MKLYRSLTPIAVALSVLAAGLGATPGDSLVAAQAAITAASLNQCKLLEAGDFNGFANTLTPDFQQTDPTGKTETREQNLSDMKQQFSQMNLKLTGCDFTVTQVRSVGNDVSVTGLATSDGTVAAPSGQTAPIHIDTRETDVWTNEGGVWLQRSSTELESTVKLNGQIVQHQGGPGQ